MKRIPGLALLLLLTCRAGCGSGTIYGGGNNNAGPVDAALPGDGALPDVAVLSDGQAPPVDAAPLPDAAVQQDAAPTGCTANGCPPNAWCDAATETCHCLTGFLDDGQGGCDPIAPGDPAARTQQDMCTRWLADHQTTASSVWTAGPSNCDLGTLSTGAIADAVAYVNVYRFLTGLAPLADDPALNEDAQYCAIIQYRQGYLSHSPDPGTDCYTSQGASAAGASNLALGTSTTAGAIDLFIDDSGVSSLGHRRWVLNPSYGPAGVGFAGNATCLYVFSWSNPSNVDFVAWPNQGFTPISVMPGTWSFGSGNYSLSSNTEVAVRRMSDQADLNVSVSLLASGYALPTLAFTPSGWSAQAGETYEVSLSSPGNPPLVVYQVKPVSCP